MNRKDFEIMAPVGSYESLYAAIQGGADAIYFGIEGLNMRARSANNFTTDDLRKIAGICDENGLKSYLTVNTIVYDEDIALMHEIVNAAKEAKISAIIASDMATILYARSIDVEVHISTQVNVSNSEAARFYAQYADVLVLARELNLTQVAGIYDTIQRDNICGPHGERLRIEMFCHGALCMAVSGKCYLSLHEMNSSANRGACTQICRRGYEVTDRETGDQLAIENKYIMSPKDLKTIHFMNNGTYSEEMVAGWDERLKKVFNRGFWNGYYLGQRLGEWTSKYGSSATRVKIYAAKGVRYFSNIHVAEFLMENDELHVGDEIVISGPTTGAIIMKVEEIRVDLKPVEKTVRGERFSIKVDERVRPSDKLYVWRDVEEVRRQRVIK